MYKRFNSMCKKRQSCTKMYMKYITNELKCIKIYTKKYKKLQNLYKMIATGDPPGIHPRGIPSKFNYQYTCIYCWECVICTRMEIATKENCLMGISIHKSITKMYPS